jgi:signal transduction histidine kinase/DNA-binding response OmpR family regulator
MRLFLERERMPERAGGWGRWATSRVSRILQAAFLAVALLALVPALVALLWTDELSQTYDDITRNRVAAITSALELVRATEIVAAEVPHVRAQISADERESYIRVIEAQSGEIERLVVAVGNLGGESFTLRSIIDRSTRMSDVMRKLATIARDLDETRTQVEAKRLAARQNRRGLMLVVDGLTRAASALLAAPSAAGAAGAADDDAPQAPLPAAIDLQAANLIRSWEVVRRTQDVANRTLEGLDAGEDAIVLAARLNTVLGHQSIAAAALPPDIAEAVAPRVSGFRAIFLDEPEGLIALTLRQRSEEALLSQLAANGETLAHQLSGLAHELVNQTRQGIESAHADATRSLANLGWALMVSAIACALIAYMVGHIYVGRMVVSRLDRLRRAMMAISRGDHFAEVPSLQSRDEIGEMARAVEVFRRNTRDLDLRNTELGDRAKELRALVGELSRARQLADAANMAKSQFLANMSHELRTPLNAIIGITEMLVEDAEAEPDSELMEPLSRVLRAGRHLLSLINDILDLSKIEAGKMELHPDTIDIRGACAELVATARPLARQNGTSIKYECPDHIGSMLADPTRFRQTLLNLLSNACKFTRQGTVTLTVRREMAPHGERVMFEVTDTGIGIKPDQIERLFRDFSQADSSTTRRFGGTGLGLAISRRFARMMGGDIVVDSEFGTGSVFTLTLPVDPSQSVHPEQSSPIAEHAVVPLRVQPAQRRFEILLIDDDATARSVMGRFLEREGFDVQMAADGFEGLRLAKERMPTVVILDVLLPKLDGWSVLAAIKADSAISSTPVIVHTILDERSRALSLGAADLLGKPFDREKLRRILKRLAAPKGHVLLIEGDDTQRFTTSRYLEEQGWAVATAGHGSEALEMLSSGVPDAIILEVGQPGGGGYAFLQGLAARSDIASAPMIAVVDGPVPEILRAAVDLRRCRIVQQQGFDSETALTELLALQAELRARRGAA